MSTKTFNRRPYQVGSPSSSDVKDYYFNHFNWKGMSTDKNFLASDQETFEECNNVYMDEEGILRSRPALQVSNKFRSCERFWVFGGIVVYLIKEPLRLLFVNDGIETSQNIANENVLLLMKSDKIFCFTTSEIYAYDVNDKTVKNANSSIYIPTVSVSSIDVTTKNESKNLLSDMTIKNYLYDSELGLPSGLKSGDNVTIEMEDTTYETIVDRRTIKDLLYEKVGDDFDSLPEFSHTVFDNKDVLAAMYSTGDLFFSYDNGRSWKYIDTIPGSRLSISRTGFSKDSSLYYVVGSSAGGNKQIWIVDAITANAKYPKFYTFRTCSSYVYDVAINFFDNKEYVCISAMYSESGYFYSVKIDTFSGGEQTYLTKAFDERPWIGSMDIVRKGDVLRTVVGIGYEFYSNIDSDELTLLFRGSKNYSSVISISNGLIIVPDGQYISLYNLNGSLIKSLQDDSISLALSYSGNKIATYRGVWDLSNYTFSSRIVEINGNVVAYGICSYRLTSNQPIQLYSSNISKPITIVKKHGNLINENFFKSLSTSKYAELNAFYIAIEKLLVINEDRYDEDGNFLWYFPEYTKQEFAKPITKLFPISANEMAIFFDDEIWYSSHNEGVYSYYKSKLPVGLKQGSDVIVSYDGSNVIFATDRGLAALSYQDFVASSEQTLTFLSDPIHKLFKEFVASPVKICRYQYWYLCYSTDNKKGYLFDVRNNSWWPLESLETVDKFFVFDNEVVLFKNGTFLTLNKTDDDYKDKIGGSEYDINWNFKSQKLHFGAINYNKHIANITLYAVLDSDDIVRFKMEVNNYRKKMDTAEIQSIEYRVDAIRTFVKRVSYFKVNEFQYNIHQDDEEAIKLPLSLSGITVKYRISGEVR